MSYFKRFGDFCAGFAAFSAILYVFREFMEFTPKETVPLLEKLKLFFSDEPRREYRTYLILIGLLLLSLLISLLLHRFPYLSFATSVPPLLHIMLMYDAGLLYERPMLYFVLGGVHACGCLAECIRRDREDRRRRAAIAADLCGLVGMGLCGYVLRITPTIPDVPYGELNFFERQMYFSAAQADLTLFRRLLILLAVTVALRWLLRDLYYLDAALAVGLFGYTLYHFYAKAFPFFGSMLLMLTAVYALSRVVIMLSCKPKRAYGSDDPSKP
ncbi:MAG: hypothetical protein E7668_06455 [Ruminococcaceae bacterium]|nr:hypothetical protein [Oscillospiraceae bacterium]